MGASGPTRQCVPDRFALAGIMLLALAARLWIVATHTYIAHPDETFQYLEPAHRLAFGSGVIAWEYLDGIRSWLLPGAIAGVMRLVALFDGDPRAYVLVLRLLCVAASMAIPYAGYRIAEQVAGSEAAILAGLLCALSPQAVYFAPVIMTEPLATDAALLAIMIGGGARGRARRLLLAGVLFGLACALRYQYAPALGVAALWQHARDRRSFWLVASAGAAVVVLLLGVLDAATWRAPFQSVWLNYLRNGPQGVSRAMGARDWYYYLLYFLAAWGVTLPILTACLVLAARRAPAPMLMAGVTIGLHTIAPHKEIRFIFLALATMPILIGIGLHEVAQRLPKRWSGLSVQAGLAVTLAVAIAATTLSTATRPDAWHRDRSVLQATAAARAIPGVCGLGLRSISVYRSGGYSYWHRDVPLFFELWYPAQILWGSAFQLRSDGLLDGRRIPQYQTEEMPAHPEKFNAMIGVRSDTLPGFTVRSCFGLGTIDDRTICVFTRPGGCS